jgi:YD repeat-containing protein
MTEGNPLVAAPVSTTTGVTGIGILESAQDLSNGVKDGSWVEGGLGALGVGLEVLSMVIDPLGTLAQYGVAWLIEHVRPLKEALDWLAGDPPVIQSFSDTWANVAAEVGSIAGDLGNEVNNGTAGWSGEGADTYRGAGGEQAEAIAGAASLAEGISAGVMIMGTVVGFVREMVRDIVAELVGKLITWALEAACTLGFATPLIAAQATTAISSAVTRISDFIRKLVKTVGNVSPRISKIIGKLDEIMQALRKLGRKLGGGEGTSPSSAPGGGKVDTPDLDGDVTTPSGSHSPDGPDGPRTDTPGGRDGSLRDGSADPRDTATEPVGRCGRKEPIDAATGEMFLVQTDVDLPGLLPLVLERTHVSSYRSGRCYGRTWASTLDQRLEFDERGVCYAGPAGVILVYPTPLHSGEPVMPAEGARWPLARTADGGYTITQPENGLTLRFPAESGGRAAIAAVLDRNGNRMEFGYDADGTPVEVRHSGGYHVAVSSEHGFVTALSLRSPGAADVVLARYDYADGRLAAVWNSSGLPLRFAYDHVGRIVRWEDRHGHWYGYEYDAEGRCVRTTGSGDALTGTFEYDPANRRTVETDSLGGVTVHEFDELHQLVRQVNPLGHEIVQEWAAHGRLAARTDPLGRTTRYTYDDGNLTTITRPDGTQEWAEYNEFRLPVVRVDADGAVWRYGYDDAGNLVSLTDPTGATESYGHDEHGRLRSITDALGNVRRVETDPAGLPVSVVDANGGVTTFERDQFGRVTAMTNPAGGVTRFGWTVEGELRYRTQPDGSTEQWRYDAEGNQIAYVDALGQVTRTATTHFELPAAEIRPDGARLEFRYDTELRLTEVIDPRGLVWRYEYDPAGNLVRETDFNGRTVQYRHDAAGQLVERTNGAGETVTFVRDALGNVIERRSADSVVRFTYDQAERIVSATARDVRLTVERDALGRVLAETVNGRTVVSRYDALGRRTYRRTPTGVESHWQYDGNGKPVNLDVAGRSVSFGYDAAGREIERLLATGTVLAQTWDTNHRLTSQTVSAVGAPAGRANVLQQRRFDYRPDGSVASIEDRLLGPRPAGSAPCTAGAGRSGTPTTPAETSPGRRGRNRQGKRSTRAPASTAERSCSRPVPCDTSTTRRAGWSSVGRGGCRASRTRGTSAGTRTTGSWRRPFRTGPPGGTGTTRWAGASRRSGSATTVRWPNESTSCGTTRSSPNRSIPGDGRRRGTGSRTRSAPSRRSTATGRNVSGIQSHVVARPPEWICSALRRRWWTRPVRSRGAPTPRSGAKPSAASRTPRPLPCAFPASTTTMRPVSTTTTTATTTPRPAATRAPIRSASPAVWHRTAMSTTLCCGRTRSASPRLRRVPADRTAGRTHRGRTTRHRCRGRSRTSTSTARRSTTNGSPTARRRPTSTAGPKRTPTPNTAGRTALQCPAGPVCGTTITAFPSAEGPMADGRPRSECTWTPPAGCTPIRKAASTRGSGSSEDEEPRGAQRLPREHRARLRFRRGAELGVRARGCEAGAVLPALRRAGAEVPGRGRHGHQ